MKLNLPQKNGFLSFTQIPPPPLEFLQVLNRNITLFITKLRVLALCFSYFTDNFTIYH
jgi:hypothetical protein